MDGLSSKWTLLGRDWGAESVPCLCVCEREIEEEGGVHGGERREERERVSELHWYQMFMHVAILLYVPNCHHM
jgi:hypothetical protein